MKDVPPWLLDDDEILHAPHDDLARSPISVRLYVGDLEARCRELERVADDTRTHAWERAWPRPRRRPPVARPRGAQLNAVRALEDAA